MTESEHFDLCLTCGHRLPHKFELPKPAGILNMFVTQPVGMIALCDYCPGGKCQPKRADANVVLIGFSPIRDMSRIEMVEELLAFQRRQLDKVDAYKLTQLLVNVRIYDYAMRVKAEAGLSDPQADDGTGLISVE